MNKYKTSKWVKTNCLTIKEAFSILSSQHDNGDPLCSNGISKAQNINILKTYLKKHKEEKGEDFDLCSDSKTQVIAAKIAELCF